MGSYRPAKIKLLLVGLQLTCLHGFLTKNINRHIKKWEARKPDSSEDDYCNLWGTGPAETCAFQSDYNNDEVPQITPTISRAAVAASQACLRDSLAIDMIIYGNFLVKDIKNVMHETEIYKAVILQNTHENTRIVTFCTSVRWWVLADWRMKQVTTVDGRKLHVIKYYLDIFEKFSPWFYESLHAQSESTVITGHGLGGAVAVVARLSNYLVRVNDHRSGISRAHLITFGAPMVGDRSFARAIENDGFGYYLRYDFCRSLTMRQNRGTGEKKINLSLSGTAVIFGADSNHLTQYFVQRRSTTDKALDVLCQPKTFLESVLWSPVPVVRSIFDYVDYLG